MQHTAKDFKEGDKVYHISHTDLKNKTIMVVIFIPEDIERVDCRWITRKGKKRYAEFEPFELEIIKS